MLASTRCPTCKRASTREANKAYPFCCERCQLVDLGRWLNEEYRIPVEDDEIEDERRLPEKPRE
jgi:uncharacterized protein